MAPHEGMDFSWVSICNNASRVNCGVFRVHFHPDVGQRLGNRLRYPVKPFSGILISLKTEDAVSVFRGQETWSWCGRIRFAAVLPRDLP